MFLRNKDPNPKEAAKEAKKGVRQGTRDIDKELRNLERSEKQLIAEIKKTAKGRNNERATRTLAKQLVDLRKTKEKLYIAKGNINGLGYRTTALASNAAMAGVMKDVGASMATMNNAVSTKEMMKVMEEFSRQNEAMGMREELMDDALIDAFDGDQEEENAIVDQILAEVGMEATGKMLDAPQSKPITAQKESAATAEEDKLADQRADELLKQLGAL